MYVQSDTLLLAEILENFRNTCLKYRNRFLSAPGLQWEPALKKTRVKLDLLTDIVMSLMLQKGKRGGICHSIY